MIFLWIIVVAIVFLFAYLLVKNIDWGYKCPKCGNYSLHVEGEIPGSQYHHVKCDACGWNGALKREDLER